MSNGFHGMQSTNARHYASSVSPKVGRPLTKREINKVLLEKRYAHMLKDEVVKPKHKMLKSENRSQSAEAFPTLGV